EFSEETLDTLPGLRKTPQLMRKFAESGLIHSRIPQLLQKSKNSGQFRSKTPQLIQKSASLGVVRENSASLGVVGEKFDTTPSIARPGQILPRIRTNARMEAPKGAPALRSCITAQNLHPSGIPSNRRGPVAPSGTRGP